LEKQPKWGFWGNFGPFENVELSWLNPKFSEKNWVQPAQLDFLKKIGLSRLSPILAYVLNIEM